MGISGREERKDCEIVTSASAIMSRWALWRQVGEDGHLREKDGCIDLDLLDLQICRAAASGLLFPFGDYCPQFAPVSMCRRGYQRSRETKADDSALCNRRPIRECKGNTQMIESQ